MREWINIVSNLYEDDNIKKYFDENGGYWYENTEGETHNPNGAAVVYANGARLWFINGHMLSKMDIPRLDVTKYGKIIIQMLIYEITWQNIINPSKITKLMNIIQTLEKHGVNWSELKIIKKYAEYLIDKNNT